MARSDVLPFVERQYQKQPPVTDGADRFLAQSPAGFLQSQSLFQQYTSRLLDASPAYRASRKEDCHQGPSLDSRP